MHMQIPTGGIVVEEWIDATITHPWRTRGRPRPSCKAMAHVKQLARSAPDMSVVMMEFASGLERSSLRALRDAAADELLTILAVYQTSTYSI